LRYFEKEQKSTAYWALVFAVGKSASSKACLQYPSPWRKIAKMETAIALIALGIITILVMPNLLSKEVIIGLIALGILSVVRPDLFSRDFTLALVAFGILFSLVIPGLMK
jgi:hypothetical protein